MHATSTLTVPQVPQNTWHLVLHRPVQAEEVLTGIQRLTRILEQFNAYRDELSCKMRKWGDKILEFGLVTQLDQQSVVAEIIKRISELCFSILLDDYERKPMHNPFIDRNQWLWDGDTLKAYQARSPFPVAISPFDRQPIDAVHHQFAQAIIDWTHSLGLEVIAPAPAGPLNSTIIQADVLDTPAARLSHFLDDFAKAQQSIANKRTQLAVHRQQKEKRRELITVRQIIAERQEMLHEKSELTLARSREENAACLRQMEETLQAAREYKQEELSTVHATMDEQAQKLKAAMEQQRQDEQATALLAQRYRELRAAYERKIADEQARAERARSGGGWCAIL